MKTPQTGISHTSSLKLSCFQTPTSRFRTCKKRTLNHHTESSKKKSTYIIKQNTIFQIKQINTRNENLRFFNYIFPCFLRKQTGITDRRRRKLGCRERERERKDQKKEKGTLARVCGG